MTEMMEPSLWAEVNGEAEAQKTARLSAYAVASVEPIWEFLAQAQTHAEYDTRKALAEASITRLLSASLGDQASEYLLKAVQALDERFAAHLEAQSAQKVVRGLQEAAAARVQAALGAAEGLTEVDPLTLKPGDVVSDYYGNDRTVVKVKKSDADDVVNIDVTQPDGTPGLKQVPRGDKVWKKKSSARTAAQADYVTDYTPGSKCPYCKADPAKVKQTSKAGSPLTGVDRYKCDECGGGMSDKSSHRSSAKTAAFPRPDDSITGGWSTNYWGGYQHGETGQVIYMYRKGQRVRFFDDEGNQVGEEHSNVAPAAGWALSNGYHNPDLAGLGPIGGSKTSSKFGPDFDAGIERIKKSTDKGVLEKMIAQNDSLLSRIKSDDNKIMDKWWSSQVEMLKIQTQTARERISDLKTKASRKVAWIDQAREIVDSNQHQTVDGMILDLFSASAMVQIHDSLSGHNQEKFARMPLAQAHDIAMKLLSKTSASRTAATKAQPQEGTTKDIQTGRGDMWTRAKCANCDKQISKKSGGGVKGWVHQSGSKWCSEDWQKSSKTAGAYSGPAHPEYPGMAWSDPSVEGQVLTAVEQAGSPEAAVAAIMQALNSVGYDSMDREMAFWIASQQKGWDYNDLYDSWLRTGSTASRPPFEGDPAMGREAISYAMTCENHHMWESKTHGDTCPTCGKPGHRDQAENIDRYSSLGEQGSCPKCGHPQDAHLEGGRDMCSLCPCTGLWQDKKTSQGSIQHQAGSNPLMCENGHREFWGEYGIPCPECGAPTLLDVEEINGIGHWLASSQHQGVLKVRVEPDGERYRWTVTTDTWRKRPGVHDIATGTEPTEEKARHAGEQYAGITPDLATAAAREEDFAIEVLQAEAALSAADGDLERAAAIFERSQVGSPPPSTHQHQSPELVPQRAQEPEPATNSDQERRERQERRRDAPEEKVRQQMEQSRPLTSARDGGARFAVWTHEDPEHAYFHGDNVGQREAGGEWIGPEEYGSTNFPGQWQQGYLVARNRVGDLLSHAVNTDAQGAERYQHTPAPADPEWVEDAWDAKDEKRSLEQGRADAGSSNPVRAAALRLLAAEAPKNLYGDQEADEFDEKPKQIPHTTRPRVKPSAPANIEMPGGNHMQDQGDGTYQQRDLHQQRDQGFSMPSFEQQVAARVAKIATQVQADNPHLSVHAAREIAASTVARFPEMVRTR